MHMIGHEVTLRYFNTFVFYLADAFAQVRKEYFSRYLGQTL